MNTIRKVNHQNVRDGGNPIKSFFYKLLVRNFKFKALAFGITAVIWLLVVCL
jgi:hypothetical protein